MPETEDLHLGLLGHHLFDFSRCAIPENDSKTVERGTHGSFICPTP
jgi:hypothetical protein